MIEPLKRAAADTRPDLKVAYLVLVERAGRAAFARGPAACHEFVSAVRGQLAANDEPSERLRVMAPEVAIAEVAACDMLRLRCKTCPVGCAARDN